MDFQAYTNFSELRVILNLFLFEILVSDCSTFGIS